MNKAMLRFKKILLFLTFTLIVSTAKKVVAAEIWDGSIATEYAGGDGTEENPYQISNGSELALLAKKVNALQVTYKKKFFILTEDIYLNDTTNWKNWNIEAPENSWKAIGIYDADKEGLRVKNGILCYEDENNPYQLFYGTFDGDGHKIIGMYIRNAKNSQGLFGAMSNGCVKNLIIEKSFIKGTENVGSICGYAQDKTLFVNCKSNATVIGRSSVGGIVGSALCSSRITDCSNTGKINGTSSVGGVVGNSSNFVKGYAVKNCTNSGEITSTLEGVFIGGVIGSCWGSINNCHNTGNLVISGRKYYIGGVAGEINWSDSKIINCSNSGKIHTGNNAGSIGGIIGTSSGRKIYNCINIGNIEIGNNCGGIGGILGDATESTIKNVINLGNITTGKKCTSIAGICYEGKSFHHCINGGQIRVKNGMKIGNMYAQEYSNYNPPVENCYSCFLNSKSNEYEKVKVRYGSKEISKKELFTSNFVKKFNKEKDGASILLELKLRDGKLMFDF